MAVYGSELSQIRACYEVGAHALFQAGIYYFQNLEPYIQVNMGLRYTHWVDSQKQSSIQSSVNQHIIFCTLPTKTHDIRGKSFELKLSHTHCVTYEL